LIIGFEVFIFAPLYWLLVSISLDRDTNGQGIMLNAFPDIADAIENGKD
jgi:hypothetical protein